MIRILLVDDQAILCEMLQSRLEGESDFEVVGSAHDGGGAIKQVAALRPDIVLLDIQMPGMDGVTATKIICKRFPDTKVIVLSGHDNDAYLTNALQSGAKGYLLKDTATSEVANTIRSVYRGQSQIGPGLLEKLMARVTSSSTEASPSALSAPANSLSSQLSESELQELLAGFDSIALLEVSEQIRDAKTSDKLFNRLEKYLQTEETNLAALYLAGVWGHRNPKKATSAFNYLKFGFQEGMKQGLSLDDLLLFYRAGKEIQPEYVISWLIQEGTPWSSRDNFSFVLTEASQLFGKDSLDYQALLSLGQIRAMSQLDEDFTTLGSKIEDLQQNFERLNQLNLVIEV